MQLQEPNSTRLHIEAFTELMKGVYTCIPGHILTFDPDNQRAQIQVGILRVDINGATYTLPPIINVPVYFQGDDFIVETQIDPGCEGMIFFAQRCTDGWKNTGGVADNPLANFHDMQDAFFLPGFRSLPNVITDFQNNGIRLRNKDGSRYFWIKNDGSSVVKNGDAITTYGADDSVTTTNGNGTIILLPNGNISLNGVIITPMGKIIPPPTGGIVGANGVDYETHRHQETGTITNGPIP